MLVAVGKGVLALVGVIVRIGGGRGVDVSMGVMVMTSEVGCAVMVCLSLDGLPVQPTIIEKRNTVTHKNLFDINHFF